MQGVDFFFSKRSHAQRFLDFLHGVVPLRYRTDKQLVSHNEQNATYNYKYTFSVEIVPICKVCDFKLPNFLHTFVNVRLASFGSSFCNPGCGLVFQPDSN